MATVKKWLVGSPGSLTARNNLRSKLCDQIGRFLKVLGCKFSYKVAQLFWQLARLLWNTSIFSKNCCGSLLDNYWKNLSTFNSSIWSHCRQCSELRRKKDWGATIAQWICLRLPSCRLGSSRKHTNYAFINLYLIVLFGNDKNKHKEAGIGPFFQKER